MKIEVILDSGYIEVLAWVEVDEDEIIILDLHYDGQQVRVDKLHPELERQIDEVAIDEWSARGE
tara:strand:- start:42 stop:233 length:192 start_codon:yes stop_codon:yes gene_type:complete